MDDVSDTKRTGRTTQHAGGEPTVEPARVSSDPLPTIDLDNDKDRLDAPSGLLPSPTQLLKVLRFRSRSHDHAHDPASSVSSTALGRSERGPSSAVSTCRR